MKLLFLLALLLIFALLLWSRYRRHIESALYIFRIFRKMQQVDKGESPKRQFEKPVDVNDIQLVRCAKCGNWITQTNSFKFGTNSYFCSAVCMETKDILPTKHSN